MTKKEIEEELTKIYEEMKSWSKVNRELNYVIYPRMKLRKESCF